MDKYSIFKNQFAKQYTAMVAKYTREADLIPIKVEEAIKYQIANYYFKDLKDIKKTHAIIAGSLLFKLEERRNRDDDIMGGWESKTLTKLFPELNK